MFCQPGSDDGNPAHTPNHVSPLGSTLAPIGYGEVVPRPPQNDVLIPKSWWCVPAILTSDNSGRPFGAAETRFAEVTRAQGRIVPKLPVGVDTATASIFGKQLPRGKYDQRIKEDRVMGDTRRFLIMVTLLLSLTLVWSGSAMGVSATGSAPVSAPPLNAQQLTFPSDRVVLEKVAPEPGTPLMIGHPVQFRAELQSTLVSHDTAILQVYVEMFPKSAGGCVGPSSETNGGTYANVRRGTSTLVMNILWPGSAPGPVAWTEGFISLGASFWINRNQQMRSFGILRPTWCYPYSAGHM